MSQRVQFGRGQPKSFHTQEADGLHSVDWGVIQCNGAGGTGLFLNFTTKGPVLCQGRFSVSVGNAKEYLACLAKT